MVQVTLREHDVAAAPHCSANCMGGSVLGEPQSPDEKGAVQTETLALWVAPPSGSGDHARVVVVVAQM